MIEPSLPAHAAIPQPIVGWRERIDIPEWGVRRIRAKLDTGARTSAIHVTHFEAAGPDRVRFEVVTRERPQRRTVRVEAALLRWSSVRPSTGDLQQRPVVLVEIRIGAIRRSIELSLVPRDGMLCRMLVGRTALAGLLVDPAARNIASAKGTP
jgi:hypothetical protein